MSATAQHPGVFLLERYLRPLGITPPKLAEALGVEIGQVVELVNGRRSITPDTAARLALFFDVPTRWWLELQARYDAAKIEHAEELRDIVTPYEGLAEILVTPTGVKRLDPPRAPQADRPKATFSKDFLHRLREQAKWADARPRTVSETTFEDGTVALLGE